MDTLTRVAFEHPELADLDPAARRLALRDLVLAEDGDPAEAALVADEIDGWGPLSALMRDPSVTDILINGHDDVHVERDGRLEPSDVTFDDDQHLRRSVDRWLGRAGARADASMPVADACLDDGSRLHVVLPPIASAGLLVSIRRFPQRFSIDQLVEVGCLAQDQADLLFEAVAARRSIVIAGATGTGKTTLLNALLAEVPRDQRVVMIEEVREICVPGSHVVSLVTRSANVQGAGAVGLGDLVRASLRMRPDRIVVGEVRGGEVLDAFDAMASGHRGSMITVHATSARAVRSRLAALAAHRTGDATTKSFDSRIDEALDVIVFLEKLKGVRKATFVGTLTRELESGQRT